MFFPKTKGDRQLKGTSFKAPALSRLCPVTAYLDWIALAGLTTGPVFRSIDRWDHVGSDGLHPNSLVQLLRRLLAEAGIASAELYSGHSLRRGFANWATANGWDLKMLMSMLAGKASTLPCATSKVSIRSTNTESKQISVYCQMR
ncbi:hypothetical protein QN379_03345 [Glaciimonas sp. Gout2]|uniref:hypothetical protein n=1 Tax=Glaciimonas sp. Gout2 TaxID=3048625 RepID=UPI002B23A186|nr:hypothetical protein [Glaciimonas sp. Gout2]MEB0081049.1 hypothetical protein [Glaciimonas sp. Gout2]